jgi:hypothetical protein
MTGWKRRLVQAKAQHEDEHETMRPDGSRSACILSCVTACYPVLWRSAACEFVLRRRLSGFRFEQHKSFGMASVTM